MPDLKSASVLSKGVARGHILCCCAVVFACFTLTCLNLYMLSSTRVVLRRLEDRLDARTRSQPPQQSPEEAAAAVAAMLQQQVQQVQQLQQEPGADDFVLLAPSDLDNAWTTQTGRLLVPVGQPEEEDDGWKQMQVQLAQQQQQQRHIEGLHDRLSDQYRAREELHRDQQDLIRQQHELARKHQREMAKKDRQLLKEKHRALKQGAEHKDELRRVQTEVDQLKKVVEEVQSLDPSPTTEAAPPASSSGDASTPAAAGTGFDAVVSVVEETAPEVATATTEANGPLDHIFSAVFGPSPGSYFFPSYTVAAEAEDAKGGSRGKRDLADDVNERRERRLARLSARLGVRRRRHGQEAGPIMRIDDGKLVPLTQAAVVLPDAEDGLPLARLRRLAARRRP